MANSRQVALRTRLRHHYWLTECKPISAVTVATMRRKTAMIDAQDTMPDEQVAELLSPHYGFVEMEDARGQSVGWFIPDLEEALQAAVGSIVANRQRFSAMGRASAAKRAAGGVQAGPQVGPQAAVQVPEQVDAGMASTTVGAGDDDF